MIVIADTTPINYLVVIEAQELLHALFGRVIIAGAVWHQVKLTQNHISEEDAFSVKGTCDVGGILVFTDRDDADRRFAVLFDSLEHARVCGEARGLTLGELSYQVSGAEVDRLMHGLRLRYIAQPTIWRSYSPVVKVAPIILLRFRYGVWFRVEEPPKEFEIHHAPAMTKPTPKPVTVSRVHFAQERRGIARPAGVGTFASSTPAGPSAAGSFAAGSAGTASGR